MIKKFFGISDAGLGALIFRSGIGSLIVRLINMLCMVALAAVLARVCGVQGYGVYVYVFAIVQVLSIPARIGLHVLVVREIASFNVSKQWGYLKGVLLLGTLIIFLTSVAISLIVICVSSFFEDSFSGSELDTLNWGLMLLIVIAFGNFFGSSLRGLHKVVYGQLPDRVIRPSVFLGFVLLYWYMFPVDVLSPEYAMAFHALSGAIALIFGLFLLHYHIPNSIKAIKAHYKTSLWLKSATALSLIEGLQVISSQTDILMLGFFTDAQTVGAYSVAAQGAILVAFGLQSLNMIAAPYYSKFYKQQDFMSMQKLALNVARLSTLIALPAVFLFLFYGTVILTFIFGEEFVIASNALNILCLGQLINAAMGSVVLLLNMTGNEKNVIQGLIVSACSNVVLNFLLIPVWGMEGAAAATCVSLLLWNLILSRKTLNKLNIKAWVSIY